MIFLFYFFAAILVFLGYKSLRGGINFLNFFKQELSKPSSNFEPFCSIIAPCRGLDDGLEENLAALFRQNFPAYEIIFVVDSKEDSAVSIIENVRRQFQHKDTEKQRFSKIIVAGKAADESQKVHNLRQAVLRVSNDAKVFVFVDSDARPSANWLRDLINPLTDETVGAATGYRWFVHKKGSLATHLRAVWNASVASALGADLQKNFCWGGAMAVRRATFEKLNLREKLKGTLSDDFTITHAMKNADLSIYFVPQCLTATVEDCTFAEMIEFTTRQMKITRVYAANLWKASFAGSFLFALVFWTGVVLLFFLDSRNFWITFAFLSLIFALGAAKSWLRLKAVKLVLTDYEKQLSKSFPAHLLLWTITPVIYFYNDLRAFFSNEICWRGIRYKLKSPRETVIMRGDKKF